jgi:hypothetical protein
MSSHILASLVLLGLGSTIALGCGGRVSARSPDTDGGSPAPGAVDSGGPDGSCPASYADVPQGISEANTSCPVAEACSYFGQFMCFCNEGSGWECIASNCICSSEDGGCVNVACSSDADCPSGQHCAVGLGSPTTVCSAGCEDGVACPAGATCKMFAP